MLQTSHASNALEAAGISVLKNPWPQAKLAKPAIEQTLTTQRSRVTRKCQLLNAAKMIPVTKPQMPTSLAHGHWDKMLLKML
jgi:hypothetical protein